MSQPTDRAPSRTDGIDERFVPRRREDLESVEIEGETVLTLACEGWDDQYFDSHWLDGPATVIWKLFDGHATLGELAEDLSDAFAVGRDEMLRDVLDLTHTLGRAGLLDGVIAERPVRSPPSAHSGMPIGTQVPPFRLTGLDARDLTEAVRTGSTLLVNWSPGCGYCTRMAKDLAAAGPGLAARGHELVLVASGSVEDNLRLLEESGLACTVASNDGFELFEGLGTPVAYLLDEGGRLASELATGGVEVMALVRQAAALDEGH